MRSLKQEKTLHPTSFSLVWNSGSEQGIPVPPLNPGTQEAEAGQFLLHSETLSQTNDLGPGCCLTLHTGMLVIQGKSVQNCDTQFTSFLFKLESMHIKTSSCHILLFETPPCSQQKKHTIPGNVYSCSNCHHLGISSSGSSQTECPPWVYCPTVVCSIPSPILPPPSPQRSSCLTGGLAWPLKQGLQLPSWTGTGQFLTKTAYLGKPFYPCHSSIYLDLNLESVPRRWTAWKYLMEFVSQQSVGNPSLSFYPCFLWSRWWGPDMLGPSKLGLWPRTPVLRTCWGGSLFEILSTPDNIFISEKKYFNNESEIKTDKCQDKSLLADLLYGRTEGQKERWPQSHCLIISTAALRVARPGFSKLGSASDLLCDLILVTTLSGV